MQNTQDSRRTRPVRVLLADDHPLRQLRADLPGVRVARAREAGAAANLAKESAGPTIAEDAARVFAGRRPPTARQAA